MRELVIAHCNEYHEWHSEQPFKTMVYCKGKRIPGGWPTPNIGREGHTFALHVFTNWHHLADITIFAQGHPFDHCRDFILRMQGPCEWFEWLGDDLHGCNHEGLPHRPMPMGQFYENLMEQPFPELFEFYAGGMFMATRECLRSVPLNKWQAILDQATHPDFPWLMERMWGSLLNREPRFVQPSVLANQDSLKEDHQSDDQACKSSESCVQEASQTDSSSSSG